MKRLIIIVLLVAGVLAASKPALAQTPVEFDKMDLSIWPEFDHPGVLIIYRITLSAASALPAQISIRLPRTAQQPYTVANQDVDGLLYNLTFTTVQEADWVRINFTAPSANLQIEYYDSLPIANKARDYKFQWPGDYAVKELNLNIQQPSNAANMTIVPQMGIGTQGSDGLLYYSAKVGSVPVGQTFNVQITYDKPDNSLSTTAMPVTPKQPITNSTSSSGSPMSGALPWILGGVGMVLVVGGVVWYVISSRSTSVPAGVRRHSSHVRERSPSMPVPSAVGTIYCHQCGKRASTGDIFCRSCGTRLQTE